MPPGREAPSPPEHGGPPISRIAEKLQGVVQATQVRAGTASAHAGAVLLTDAGERLVLVRLRGHPFEDDQARALDGCRVEVEGYRLGGELRFLRLDPLP